MVLLPRVTENVASCGCQCLSPSVYHELSYGFTKDVVLIYFFYLVLFTVHVLSIVILIYSMVVFESITCQTVMSDPSFWCSDTGNVALEEECEEIVGVQPVGQE